MRGIVGVEWSKTNDSRSLTATIPGNTRAKISVPKAGMRDVVVREGDKLLWKNGAYVGDASSIIAGVEEADYVTFDAGTGKYNFAISGTETKIAAGGK